MERKKFKINFRKKHYRASNNWGFEKMQIQKFWKYSTGKQIKIAVLDSGIPDHPDLIINREKSRNFVMTESGLDNYDHATSVVGLLNAQLNFKDVEGICPDAEIICLKVLDHEGGGEEGEIKRALIHCIELKPDIINLSFGTQERLGNDFEDILERLKRQGTFIVCSSGNRNSNVLDYPARSEHTIAVGAIDPTNSKSDFSSYGTGIDFVFPGSNLFTTCGTNRYCYVSGTSFSTPIFSGILALYLGYLKSIHREYTYDEVFQELKRCAIDLGSPGEDEIYGYGSIDLDCLFTKVYDEQKKLPWYSKFWNFLKSAKR